MEEIWKDIKGYDGIYQVSNKGRVKSFVKGEKVMSPTDNGNGYKIVGLGGRRNKKNHYVHRLVAEAFLKNEKCYREVNHIDENTANNNLGNLEWCDRKYNATYGTAAQRQAETKRRKYASGEIVACWKGKHLPEETRNKISERRKGKYGRAVMCIETQETFETIKDAAVRYGIYPSGIGEVCRGKMKTYKRKRFKYI